MSISDDLSIESGLFDEVNKTTVKLRYIYQWWIQDFPQGAPISKVGPTYYLTIFSQICMKVKKFWPRRGGGASLASLKSATVCTNLQIYTLTYVERTHFYPSMFHFIFIVSFVVFSENDA